MIRMAARKTEIQTATLISEFQYPMVIEQTVSSSGKTAAHCMT